MLNRIGQERCEEAQCPLVCRAWGAGRMNFPKLRAEIVKLLLAGQIGAASRRSQALHQKVLTLQL